MQAYIHPMKAVQDARRVVVKVGTSVLTDDSHALDEKWIRQLAAEVAALKKQNRQVILVSSGAIGAGIGVLGWGHRPRQIARSQAAAAVGQGRLMQIYSGAFQKHDLLIAQILLTRNDLGHRHRYLRAQATMSALLDAGVIPIVNENDTVAVDEIKFGDNDELSALVAHLMDADLLINLSNVDGFERREPGQPRERIAIVDRITADLERQAGGAGRATSTGGMISKLHAAKLSTESGIPMLLADGSRPHVLRDILLEGHLLGTLFLPRTGKMAARKRWLAFSGRPKGAVEVDAGARRALVSLGKSLLASGVKQIEGEFLAGDLVAVRETGSSEFARGLIRYGSDDLARIQGLNSQRIAQVLGSKAKEVIHRDAMVILGSD